MPSCLQGWALLWEGSGLCQGVGISQCAVTGTEPLCTAGSGCQEQILQRRKTKGNFSITSKCSTLSHSCCETRLFFFFFIQAWKKRIILGWFVQILQLVFRGSWALPGAKSGAEQAGRELAPSRPNSDQRRWGGGGKDLQEDNQFFSLEIKSFWHHLLLILLQ